MKKIYISILTILFVLCSIIFVGCNEEALPTIYTVNFYVDGELKNTIDIDSSFELPESPTKEGYDFDGWYFDENSWQKPLTSVSLFNEEKNTGVSVYAKWSIVSYTLNISKNIQGAGSISGAGNYNYNATVELQAFTNDGYDFDGWYINSSLISSETNYSFNIKENINIIAKWHPNIYSVSLCSNDMSVGAVEGQGDYAYNSIVTIKAITNKIGYIFLGWYDLNDNLVSNQVTFSFAMSNSNINYIAKWSFDEALSNFDVLCRDASCQINGIKDKTVSEIIVPDYVTSISKGAFFGCSNLESVTLPFIGGKAGVDKDDNYQYPFGYIFGTTNFDGAEKTKQLYYGWGGHTESEEYYIPSSLKNVAINGGNLLPYAFSYCSSLEKIVLPNSIIEIPEGAFRCCYKLNNILIPNNVKQIGAVAFENCKALKTIDIPRSVTRIETQAFNGCFSLEKIFIPLTVTNLSYWVFCPQITVYCEAKSRPSGWSTQWDYQCVNNFGYSLVLWGATGIQ